MLVLHPVNTDRKTTSSPPMAVIRQSHNNEPTGQGGHLERMCARCAKSVLSLIRNKQTKEEKRKKKKSGKATAWMVAEELRQRPGSDSRSLGEAVDTQGPFQVQLLPH